MNSRRQLNKVIRSHEKEWVRQQKNLLHCEAKLSEVIFSSVGMMLAVLSTAFTVGWVLGRQERSVTFAKHSNQWLKAATLIKIKKTALNFLYTLF